MPEMIRFGEVWVVVERAAREASSGLAASGIQELVCVRDLWGRVRLLAPEEGSEEQFREIERLAVRLQERLGAHAYPADRAVLPFGRDELQRLAREGRPRKAGNIDLILVDRLLTGAGWSLTAPLRAGEKHPPRLTLFSIKGGVGRSTTVAVVAAHLARKGRRVLVLDLDLESPGVSSLLLQPSEYPDFGVVDWFVEDLVEQGDRVIDGMVASPRWAQTLPGEILVAPAASADDPEYIAKLGRVYLDRPPSEPGRQPEQWPQRFSRLLEGLESRLKPDLVLLDSRNGLHDLAAAAVTANDGLVFLLAMDSPATWAGYRILFEHWHAFGISQQLRERLKVVAALIPEIAQEQYLRSFREHAWDLFRDTLYDQVPDDAEPDQDLFSFDLVDDSAPHWPLLIYWNRGLVGINSLSQAAPSTLGRAYGDFLDGLDTMLEPLWRDNVV